MKKELLVYIALLITCLGLAYWSQLPKPAGVSETDIKWVSIDRETIKSIKWIRHKHKIPPVDDRKAGELTVKEVAARLGVNSGVVYYWIDKGLIRGRRHNAGSPYLLAVTPEVEQELAQRVAQSTRLKPQ